MIRTFRGALAAFLLLAPIPAGAETTINTLPAAITPLNCAEVVSAWQTNKTVKIPVGLIGQACQSQTSPASPKAGQFWFNTTTTAWLLKQYDGAQWVVIGTLDTVAHTWTTTGGGGGGGGGGTPGGSSGQLQANLGGSFAGITGATTNGTSVTLTLPNLIGPILGTPVSGNASNLTNIPVNQATGILPTANGGAGTITGALKGNGAGVVSQAACGDLSNAAASCSTDATNAANIGSGTLPAARLPALTGDITSTVNTAATTLATVNGGPGSVGSSTAIPVLTTNGKGLVTAQSTAAVIAPAGTLTGTALASGVTSAPGVTSINGSTVPTATDTFTLNAATQTLTNKSIAGSEINSGTVPAAQLPLATTGAFGAVKPDGTSITISAGVISAVTGGSGTVSTTGSPASGNLAKFSGATAITNGDLSGDCTTSGTLAITCTKTNGSAFVASATTDTTSASNISAGTLAAARGGAGTITGALKGNGAGVVSQAACADLSNGAASCSTDTTNASNISAGTLAAARGGAGTITGALKGSGAGVVSQAACADLSNGATGCSTATGTSGAAIPLLNGANTWSGVQSVNSGDLALKGATSGTVTLNAAATAGANTITLPAGTTDFSATGGASQVVKQTSAGGALTVGQLACSDLSNAAASCSTDATNASNISSGTIGAARLPLATTGAFGAVKPDGTTITISAGVISSAGGSTPAYVTAASAATLSQFGGL